LQRVNSRLEIVEHTVHDAETQILWLGRYVKNHQDSAIEDLRNRVAKLEAKEK
jgi:hypothetical protein